MNNDAIAYDGQHSPTSPVSKAKRAHGNAAEYTGLLVGLYLIISFAYQGGELGAVAKWTIIAVSAARIVHALGILMSASLEKVHPLKVVGSLTTYFGGALLAGLVLITLL